MLCTSLFACLEKSVGRGSLYNERTPLGPISVTTESSLSWGGGGGLHVPAVSGPRVWPSPVCPVGFCNGGMIYEEKKKMLLGIL